LGNQGVAQMYQIIKELLTTLVLLDTQYKLKTVIPKQPMSQPARGLKKYFWMLVE